jgi:hypothetical protein
MSFPVKNAETNVLLVSAKLRMRAVARFFVDQNKLSDYDKFKYIDNF